MVVDGGGWIAGWGNRTGVGLEDAHREGVDLERPPPDLIHFLFTSNKQTLESAVCSRWTFSAFRNDFPGIAASARHVEKPFPALSDADADLS